MIEGRGDRINRDLAQAEKLKTDTATALTNYAQALADAAPRPMTLPRKSAIRLPPTPTRNE